MSLESARGLTIILLVALFFLVSACSLVAGKAVAERSVEQFHTRYDAKQFHEICINAHDQLREQDSEENFVELFDAVHRKLGPVSAANLSGWEVNSDASGTRVFLSYDTQFTNGRGVEEFLWRIEDDKAKLVSYNINSRDLIIK